MIRPSSRAIKLPDIQFPLLIETVFGCLLPLFEVAKELMPATIKTDNAIKNSFLFIFLMPSYIPSGSSGLIDICFVIQKLDHVVGFIYAYIFG